LLKALEIKHFRAIGYLKIDDLGQVNILVGRAGCGKSSFLEALAIISYVLYGINQELMPTDYGILNMLQYIAARHGYVRASSSMDHIATRYDLIPATRLTFNYGGSFSARLSGTDGSTIKVEVVLDTEKCSVKRYSIEFKNIKKTLENIPAVNYVSGLDEGDISIVSKLAFLDSTSSVSIMYCSKLWENFFLKGYDEELTKLLTDMLGVKVIDLKIIPKGKEGFDILVGLKQDSKKGRIYFGDMAEGAKKALSFVLAMLYIERDGVLLAEEPEAHLHPLAMDLIADFSTKLLKPSRLQLFISTHSIELADAFSRACRKEDVDCRIIFLHREPEGFIEARILKNPEYSDLRTVGIDLRVIPELL